MNPAPADGSLNAEDVYQQLLHRAGEATPRPRIEPVQRLAELTGSPQLSYPVIQIAGTNGKTSTSRAIESLLRAHGFRTGLLTSPHLVDFTERIQIDGEPIDEPHLVSAWEEMQLALSVVDEELHSAGQSPITFFEALAVLGFIACADAPVDVAVVEVGMGGEWDATNIAHANVAVFTPIAHDHTSLLGDTIEEIARTKAGIIKPGSTVVSAAQEPAAQAEITVRCEELGVRHSWAGKDFELVSDRSGVGGRLIQVTGVTGTPYDPTYFPLFGEYQSQNMLLAIAAVEAFFGFDRAIPQDVLDTGLGTLTSPGRLQPIGHTPAVFVDAAHNPHGARALAAAIGESFTFTELILVVGVLGEKHAEQMLKHLLPIASEVFFTPVDSDRTVDPQQLAVIAEQLMPSLPVTVFDALPEALEEARGWAREAEGRGVLVTGSVVLAGEAIRVASEDGWIIAS